MNTISKLQPNWMLIKFILILMMTVFGWLNFAYAKSTDYTAWKAEQQQQDARLKHQTASASANHYLSKPSLDPAASADKIHLNTASVEQLQQLHGIGLKKAEAIVAYRNKHGKFKNIEEIQLIKGIGAAIFNKNKARLAL